MKLYRKPPAPPPAPRYETRAGEIMQIRYSIRMEREHLAGWRRRYRVAGEEEREELARWAANAEAEIARLETELNTLQRRTDAA